MGVAQAQVYLGKVEAGSLEPERDLIERAKRDPEAFAALYQRHYRMLSGYVYRRTGNVHATEDLVADTFLAVMRSLPRYRYRGVPVRSWLYRIATTTVNRWARRQRRRMTVPFDVDHLAGESVSSTQGQADGEHVQRALLSLAPRYQAVLSLYYFEGLSVKETAGVIGCREGTVRSRLARARDALRIKLIKRR